MAGASSDPKASDTERTAVESKPQVSLLFSIENGIFKKGTTPHEEVMKKYSKISMWGDAQLEVFTGEGFDSRDAFLAALEPYISCPDEDWAEDARDIDVGDGVGYVALETFLERYGEFWGKLKDVETGENGSIEGDHPGLAGLRGNAYNMWLHQDDSIDDLVLSNTRQMHGDGNSYVHVARTSTGRWYCFAFDTS